jgi:hypothetical protein
MELDAPAPCALGGRRAEDGEAVAFRISRRTLAGLDLAYPKVDKAKRKELAAARQVLLTGK